MTADVSRGVAEEPGPEDFRRLAHDVADWIADYRERVADLPVFPRVRPGEIRAALPPSPPERGEPIEEVLRDVDRIVVPGLTHWNHPAFFGYFPTTGSAAGVLGEMVAAALNVNAMVWRSAPAATELEDVTADWLRQLLGLPARFEGVINDTASSSSLYALAAAREVAYREAHRSGLFGLPPGRVYVSEQAHSSIEKAVLTLGLGQDGVRRIATDAAFTMRADLLAAAVEDDVREGVRPVAVVATLGTTSTASVDPVREVADVAQRHGVWLHVDAAYGGPAAIVPELRPLFAGWERADSIVVNPHKWLFTPIDCSLLYCSRPEELVRAFSIVPDYLSSSEQGEVRSLMDYGISLGRRFRSLKLWFVLRAFGREGIVARLRAHVAMAEALGAEIAASEGWRVVAPVRFATVAFRFAPDGLEDTEADRINQAILDAVNASGDAFLTHTVLDRRTCLRLSIGNLRTAPEHVERAWARLREAAAEALAAR